MKKNSNHPLKIAKIFSVVLIMFVFLFLFVFCVFLPRTVYSDYDTLVEKPKFTFSGLIDGSYTAQLADYFSDSVFKRDWFKVTYADMRQYFGKEYVDEEQGFSFNIPQTNPGTTVGKPTITFPPVLGDTSDPGSNSEDPNISEPPSDNKKNEELILDNGLYLYRGKVMEIYNSDVKLAKIPRFTSVLNNFAEKNPNVNVYSMVIPKQCAYYLEGSPKWGYKMQDTLNDLNAIENLLSDKVTSIDVYSTLKNHTSEHIYFATDHHWTALGAYYAAEKFATDLGLPIKSLSEYEHETREGFLGTMYAQTNQDAKVKELAEEFDIFKPSTQYISYRYSHAFDNEEKANMMRNISMERVSSWYLTFLGGDSYSWKIVSRGCENGRKLLVVKDSYGNALVPFLLDSFEEIYVVDAREFQKNLNDFVTDHGITDVLFAECSYSTVGNSIINHLAEITQ